MINIKKIFSGGIAGVANVIINMLCQVVTSAIAVRYLSAGAAGVWFVFLSIGAFITYCDFGISQTLSREIAFADKKSNPIIRINNLYRSITTLVYWILLAVLCLGVLALFLLDFLSVYPATILLALSMYFFAILLRVSANPQLALVYGSKHVATERMIRSSAAIVGTLLIWVFTARDPTLLSMALGLLCQYVVLKLLSHFFIARLKLISGFGVNLKLIWRRFYEPCRQWTFMALGALLIFQPAVMVIAKVVGVAKVPAFSLPSQIMSALIAVALMVNLALSPTISSLYKQGKIDFLKKILILDVNISVAIAITMSCVVGYNLPLIMSLWVGHSVVIDGRLFLLFAVVGILEVQHVTAAQFAMATGYIKFSRISLISAGINICLVYPAVYFLGIFGGILAIFVSQLTTNNWYAVFVSIRQVRLSTRRFFKSSSLLLVIFLLLQVAGNQLLLKLGFSRWLHFSIALGWGVLVFFGLFLQQFLTDGLSLWRKADMRMKND